MLALEALAVLALLTLAAALCSALALRYGRVTRHAWRTDALSDATRRDL